MITIKQMTVTAPFRYLWLKRITGVRLSAHCANCLKGTYQPEITRATMGVKDLNLCNGIYYLCGVSTPYRWGNNFHLAFEYSEGHTIHFCEHGIDINIENAVRLPISEGYIDMNHKHAYDKPFCTCRNWQFAHYLMWRKKTSRN